MYTEERPRRTGLLKEFVMRLILIIIFVLLILWVVPWSKLDTNPLKDQIFNSNLQTMKEAGISYFTTERLPVNVGDKTTLTLQKMLDLKLLIPFTDRNGKSCDVKKSYITLEKQETEYLMKVNLKCGDEEDYILVHLGCYSYCTSAICEAKKGNTEKSSVKPTPTATNKPVPTPTNKPKPTPTPSEKRVYEYKKTTKTTHAAEYSNWSNWTEYVKKTNDGVVYEKTATKEVEDLGTRYVKVGTKAATYVTTSVTRDELTLLGNKEYELCTEYNYYSTSASKVYKILSDWEYATGADAYYEGYNPPADTFDTRYVFVGINFDVCAETCTNHPYLIYRKQTRKVQEVKFEGSSSTECAKTEKRSVPVYVTRKVTTTEKVLKTPAQDIYANVKFYRVRTRQLIKAEEVITTSTTAWSKYNDTSLLNNGYYYTGNYKIEK